MSISEASVPVVVGRAIVAAAEARGVPGETLAKAAGLDIDLLDDADARAPALTMIRLWEEAGRLTGDESFGLHVGRSSATSGMPLAGRLIAASATLGEGLARIMAHYRVFNDVHPAEVDADGDDVVVRVLTKAIPIALPRHAIEFAFAWFVEVASIAIGERVVLSSVSFEHPAPRDVSEHRAIFGCDVAFGADESAFRAPRTLFEHANANPDPYLVEILESHAAILVEKLPARASVAAKVRAVLTELLPRGDAGIDLAAEAMRMSPRTLQRKLREEGTSFSDLVDERRCELAKRHLRERAFSIAEIALRVGFSDQSTFHRAFVRWTGRTPGDFRRGNPRP